MKVTTVEKGEGWLLVRYESQSTIEAMMLSAILIGAVTSCAGWVTSIPSDAIKPGSYVRLESISFNVHDLLR